MTSGPVNQSDPLPAVAAEIRLLLRRSGRAYLGSLAPRDGTTFPFVTLVVPAIGADLAPLLLLSDLSDHARNLQRDPHASLLFDGTADRAEPLTGPRVTLIGTAVPTSEPTDRDAYLAQRPEAALYAGFGDFRFYRLTVQEALYVAGFGRIHRLTAEDLRRDDQSPVA